MIEQLELNCQYPSGTAPDVTNCDGALFDRTAMAILDHIDMHLCKVLQRGIRLVVVVMNGVTLHEVPSRHIC
jgi:hypothetical protein